MLLVPVTIHLASLRGTSDHFLLDVHALCLGFEQPYTLCPGVPGAVTEDDTARDCCRHFAFAVPK